MNSERKVRPLIINEATRQLIAQAIARARETPIPLEVFKAIAVDDPGPSLDLKDRKPGSRPTASQFVEIQHGYLAAISFEQQPAGLCRHLSVSVDTAHLGRLPHVAAVEMIAKEFGFIETAPNRVWIEEFEPGARAVNVVQVEPT